MISYQESSVPEMRFLAKQDSFVFFVISFFFEDQFASNSSSLFWVFVRIVESHRLNQGTLLLKIVIPALYFHLDVDEHLDVFFSQWENIVRRHFLPSGLQFHHIERVFLHERWQMGSLFVVFGPPNGYLVLRVLICVFGEMDAF
jgi:hypothetical protein